MKIVELVPLINNKYLTLPIGLLLIFAGVYSSIYSGVFNSINIIYITIGVLPILLSFEKELFGVLRYVKYSDNKIIYKRTPVSIKQTIDVNNVDEIKFLVLKFILFQKNKHW